MSQIISLIQAAVVFGTVIMFGAVGEILSEKSGNLNLGVPGLMYIGGIASLMGAFYYENAVADPNKFLCIVIALVFGFGAAFIGGLIYSFLTITLRANQNVTGLTLTIFGSGFGNFFGGSLNKLAAEPVRFLFQQQALFSELIYRSLRDSAVLERYSLPTVGWYILRLH